MLFRSFLKQVLIKMDNDGVKRMEISLFELTLSGIPFHVFYKFCDELLETKNIILVLRERQLVWLDHLFKVHELIISLNQLTGTGSSELAEELLDFCKIDKDMKSDYVDRPVGHLIEFRLPTDWRTNLIPGLNVNTNDFITNAINPVVCIPADTRPNGSLVKAFLREFKPEQKLFNQKRRPGQVAIFPVDVKKNMSFVFFCVTRATAKAEILPELFLECLWDLKNVSMKLGIRSLSFPLLDWERNFLTFNSLQNLLCYVFHDSGMVLTLYPNYFLTIK